METEERRGNRNIQTNTRLAQFNMDRLTIMLLIENFILNCSHQAVKANERCDLGGSAY